MDDFASEQVGAVWADRYRLEAQLGEGGHGRVWAAVDLAATPPRPVALKVLQLQVRSNAHRRFLREARALQTLRHPGIVEALDAGVWAGVPYLVLERVGGRTLTDELVRLCAARREGSFDAGAYRARVERWIPALAEALAYVHRAGIVHRDIKPSNLMVDEADQLKLLDFGSIRDLQADIEDTTTLGRTLYSNVFFAPEQFLGQVVGPAADHFVLTSLIFVLSTLSMPWVEDDQGRPVSFDRRLRYGHRFGARAVLARMIGGRPPAVDHRPRMSAVLADGWVLDPAARGADIVGLAERWREAVDLEGLDLRRAEVRDASELEWARAWADKLRPVPVRQAVVGLMVDDRPSAADTQLVLPSGATLETESPRDPAESGVAPLTLTKTKPVAVPVAVVRPMVSRVLAWISAVGVAAFAAGLWQASGVENLPKPISPGSAESTDASRARAPRVVARAATVTREAASMPISEGAPMVSVRSASTSASTASAAVAPVAGVRPRPSAASTRHRARRDESPRSARPIPVAAVREVAAWRERLERGELSLSQARALARAAAAQLEDPALRQSLNRDLDAAYIQLDRTGMSEALRRLERARAQ